ncbi:MAG: hypothetical protein AAFY17_14265, partial [Cyanobacteria bacterium J06642_11]
AQMTFQGCRHLKPGVDLALGCLITVLDTVQKENTLILNISTSGLATDLTTLPDHWLACISNPSVNSPFVRVDTLPIDSRRLFRACCVAAKELNALWRSASAHSAIRSLGYAMHVVPPLVATGKPLKSNLYQLSFKAAAYQWTTFSTEMQQVLADMAGLNLSLANTLANTPGYAINMFPDAKSYD